MRVWPRPGIGVRVGPPEDHIFQIAIKDFLDPYTFNVKQVMKCCVGILVPDGRVIPFCAYNSVGYREQIEEELSRERTLERARKKIEFAERSNS